MSDTIAARAASPSAASPSTASRTTPRVRASILVRRLVLITSPVLAGLFLLVGILADPASGLVGEQMWRVYTENPDPLQWKSFGLHWAYTFWALPAVGAFAFLRSRGAWLANVAGLLGIVGIATLPGMLLVDFYDSAIGQVGGVDMIGEVYAVFDGMWAVSAMVLPASIAHQLCLPVAIAAFWRDGLVRWWALPASVAGIAALWLSNFTWWGAAAMAVACIALATEFALGLRRADGNGFPPA